MLFNITNVIAVGLGGFLGAILRFYINTEIVKHFPSQIPYATLSVNVLGSLLIGILIALFINYSPNETVKAFLVTGFLGALTTYSTFAIESYILLNSHFWYGILNIFLNVFGTIVAAGIGYKIITYLIR